LGEGFTMSSGWVKSPANPILRWEDHGTCFDPSILVDEAPYPKYRLYFSWRPKNAIAIIESDDALHWSEPRVVLAGVPNSSRFETHINRQTVVKRAGVYHMWYSGQGADRTAPRHAWIFHATSCDGYEWRREDAPVLGGDSSWESLGVMCPHVLWDSETGRFRMWYSGMSDGGRMYEPDSIGYAESSDGIHWTKDPSNPVFTAAGGAPCDSLKVTACQVLKHGPWHYMFYIGFETHERATICLARSRDGITGWERHPENPIISPDADSWDADACYKPSALFDGCRWLLWYNGRRKEPEQIGLTVKDGEDLGFR
jgi:beta-1,2-mannobiose phosphorylase / 1,2-beta-oligomannan phosphorylase